MSVDSTRGNILRGIAIVLLASITFLAWVFASPIGSSPDDGHHLSSIWCSSGGFEGMCEPSDSSDTRMVSKALIEAPCFALHSEISAGCQVSAGILHNLTLVRSDLGNFTGGYPPVYFAFMHLFASKNIETSALLMRVINIAIFMGLAATLWFAAPRIQRSAQRLLWPLTLIPLGLFIVASNNPSSWAITGVGFSFLSAYAFLNGTKTTLQKILLVGVYLVSALMAMGSRADAAIYFVMATGIAWLISVDWGRTKFHLRNLLVIIPVIVIAVIFYFSSGQSAISSVGFGATSTGQSPASILAYNILHLPKLFFGIFGDWGLGWLDTPMPSTVWALGAGIFIVVVAFGITKATRAQIIAYSLLIATGIAIPLYILQKSSARVGEQLQPRYLLPIFVIEMAVALIFAQGSAVLSQRRFKIPLFLALIFTQAVSLFLNIDRYVHGWASPTGFNLNSDIQWWWSFTFLSPMALFAVGSLAFAGLCYFLIEPFKITDEVTERQLVA